jgi:hypothetical protein
MTRLKFKLLVFEALVLISVSLGAYAQDEMDALRYSFLSPQGTARSMGFGSTLGSVGGDFTSLSVNPAGIGIYRKSEFMFTPSIKFNGVESRYLGNLTDDNSTRFTFNNIGIVFTRSERGKRYDRSSWKAVSFGVGINRTADFNKSYSYTGLMKGSGNAYNSFSDIFVAEATLYPGSISDDRTLAYLGYQTYLVNEDSLGFYTLANPVTGLNQLKSVRERGGISELVFTLGGNYEEKLMIGATLGLPSLRYTRETFFEETDASGDLNNDFSSFRYTESLATAGMGLNFKLGVIFKPTDLFRFGVAIHTPTWYRLSDVSNASFTANTEAYQGIQSIEGAELRPTYNLTTPWRAVVSATALIGQYGFVSADYEYVDYSSIRYRFENQFSSAANQRNQTIKGLYTGASNLRLGVEGRMDNFFIRGGFGYYGNPYKKSSDGSNRIDLSFGLGLRSGPFFTDLGFVHSRYTQYEAPYTLPAPAISPTARLENGLNNLALTIGWKL